MLGITNSMKRGILAATILLLIFAICVSADLYDQEAIDSDITPPTIDELNVIPVRVGVVELNWWISDDVQLSKYEIIKDGVSIKSKPTGGNRQSSKFQDLQAYDDHVYTFVAYDVAGHKTEKNVSLNKASEEERINAAIEEAEEEQIVIEVEPEPVVEDVPAPIVEEPAEPEKGNNLLAVAMVLIILALFWKLLTLKGPKQETHKSKRNVEMGMDDYMHKRKTKKK